MVVRSMIIKWIQMYLIQSFWNKWKFL